MNIGLFNNNKFIVYNHKSNECLSIPTQIKSIKVFDFYRDSLIIGNNFDDQLIVYDIKKHSYREIMENDSPYKFESVVPQCFL